MKILILITLFAFSLKGEEVEKVIATSLKRNVLVESEDSHGSGVILSTNLILTVSHIGASNLFVDGIPAVVLRRFTREDTMILAVPTKKLPAIKLVAKVTQDEEVYFVGNPTEHRGLIARGRIVDIENDIYIDVHLTSGASGGGVYNLSGELIGIVRAVEVSETNVIYAIVTPISNILPILKEGAK